MTKGFAIILAIGGAILCSGYVFSALQHLLVPHGMELMVLLRGESFRAYLIFTIPFCMCAVLFALAMCSLQSYARAVRCAILLLPMLLVAIVIATIKTIQLRHVVSEAGSLSLPVTIRAIQLGLQMIPLGAFVAGAIAYCAALLNSRLHQPKTKSTSALPPPLPTFATPGSAAARASENRCPYCGRTNVQEAHTCRECGTPLPR